MLILRYLAITITLSLLYGWQIHKELSDSFCLYNIQPAANYLTTNNEPITENVDKILKQNFSFIDKGAQCFAFESDDGKHVLKIFKQKRLRDALWQKLFIEMPLVRHIAIGTAEFKKRNRTLLAEGIHVASTYCKDLTGLLYTHPYPSKSKAIEVIIDGRPINLASLAFVIQIKAEPLSRALKSKNILITTQLLPLMAERARRGIYDKDSKFLNNVGFVGDKPQFIDFGEFALDPRMQEEEFASKYIQDQLESLKPYFFNLYTCDKFGLKIR